MKSNIESISKSEEEIDQELIINALNKYHDKGFIIATEPELIKIVKISKSRVRSAVSALGVKKIIKIEKHNNRRMYYLKQRIELKNEN